ncbi:hypothetical protein Tco_1278473 [Tanacetum coccineum]
MCFLKYSAQTNTLPNRLLHEIKIRHARAKPVPVSGPLMSEVLAEQVGGGRHVWPVAIHGHYADGGESVALLSGALNVPIRITGHL